MQLALEHDSLKAVAWIEPGTPLELRVFLCCELAPLDVAITHRLKAAGWHRQVGLQSHLPTEPCAHSALFTRAAKARLPSRVIRKAFSIITDAVIEQTLKPAKPASTRKPDRTDSFL